MALEISGKVVQILDLQSGTSARGDWKKQNFILETEEQYPRKICVTLWGDRVADIAGIAVGNELITASIFLESREYNGSWYTDVRAWRIQRGHGTSVPQNAAAPVGAPVPPPPPPADDNNFANSGGESFDDLPF
jgi:hypothetical protein